MHLQPQHLQKAGKEAEVPSGPQPLLILAILQEIKKASSEEDEDSTKTKQVEDLINKVQALKLDEISRECPIVRLSRTYSKPGQEKAFKLKLLIKDADILTRLREYFCATGGVRKAGIPPRGGTIKQMEQILHHLENARDDEWW